MTYRKCLMITGVLFALCFTGCKFYFNESEYLGTYTGTFKNGYYTSTYITCNGQLTIADAGNNVVDLTLTSDSNSTFTFNNLTVERGYFLNSDDLRIYSDYVDARINRNTHRIFLSHYPGSGQYYDFYFDGVRQ